MSRINDAIKATEDAMRKQVRSEASLHRPGYRLSLRMMRDSAARDELADAYGEYNDRITNAYKRAAPGPISVTAEDQQMIDAEFDSDPYGAYDKRVSNAWRSE